METDLDTFRRTIREIACTLIHAECRRLAADIGERTSPDPSGAPLVVSTSSVDSRAGERRPKPCCGSMGSRHKKDCDGKLPPEDAEGKKRVKCDDCMWLTDVMPAGKNGKLACGHCGSGNVWPAESE